MIYLILFLTFFKIGLVSFGGGYAMLPIIQKEIIENHKWISEEDMLDIVAIAESTPGPISVNTATFVGYKVAGVLGSIFATIGLAIPSLVIIFVISFFYQKFIDNENCIDKGFSEVDINTATEYKNLLKDI